MASKSPAHKRIRLDPSASPSPSLDAEGPRKGHERDEAAPFDGVETETGVKVVMEEDEGEDEDHCVICLHHIRDRTVLPCAHDRLCFECILVWTAQSRKCPLCNAPIGPFLIHNLRSKYDYSKYFLQPLRTSSPPSNISAPLLRDGATSNGRGRGRTREARWGTRGRRRSASQERADMEDELELAVERRRWVYRHGVYAKHVATNPYTRYRTAPTPTQISASPDLISRATIFVRRELRVWVNLDVEFLTTFILSLMKTLDLRSEAAVKLLAEFLDMDTPYHLGDPSERSEGRFTNAEHFSHELYSYLRSPFRDLAAYDSAVQYDTPSHIPPAPSPPPPTERRRRNLRSSTRAEPFSHRRCGSSPSPLSRSPRDAYSRSPSPVHSDSDSESVRYAPPPPPPLRSAGSSRSRLDASSKTNANTRTLEGDRKGKGKELPHSEAEGERYRRDDDGVRRTGRSGQSRRRSDTAGRSPEHHRSHSILRDKRSRRSISNVFDSLPSVGLNGKGKAVEGNPVHNEASSYSNGALAKTEPQPMNSEVVWGINIKGQAKYLGETREPEGKGIGLRQASNADETALTPNVPTKRTRNPLGLDVVHAHLGHVPAAQKARAKNPTSDENKPDAVIITPRGTATTQGSAANHMSQLRSGGGSHPLSLSSRISDSSPSATPPISQKSAREIMARTRAKLARIRDEPSLTPVADAASDVPVGTLPSEGPIGIPASNLDLRARLMERLEEEKKRTAAQPQSLSRDRWPVSQNLDGVKEAPHEGNATEPLNDGHIATGVPSESQQAEAKLRGQALLRVRLAAEKRKAGACAEERTVSREEALRAKLLSRRI